VCPACSRVYAADVFQLIRAGVTGGKTVPASVAENPLVFATLTAPSFGHVHSVQVCGRPHRSTRCCPHGRPSSCLVKHRDDDSALDQPLCADCYDYRSQIVWQWWSPDLWRRFTIILRRLVAKSLGVPRSLVDQTEMTNSRPGAPSMRQRRAGSRCLRQVERGARSPSTYDA
jgi:hypothetical protein